MSEARPEWNSLSTAERCRIRGDCHQREYAYENARYAALFREAADEIERLQSGIEQSKAMLSQRQSEIDRLTLALSESEERGERWKAEATKFTDWFDAPHPKGGVNLDWFDRDEDTGMSMLDAMRPLDRMVKAARALNDIKEPKAKETER